MKKLAFAIALLASGPAFAQDAPKPETPVEAPKAPPAAPTHWTLDLDQNDITTINQCVGELPYKIAQPFVLKVQSHLKPVQ